jgi:hypothetical protein
MWPLFRVTEDDLRDKGIEPRDYSFTVIGLLRRWALARHLEFIPVPTFCSDWVIDRYIRVYQSSSVTIYHDEENVSALYSELLIGRLYVQRNLMDVAYRRDIIEEMKPVMSAEWLRLHESKGLRSVMDEAISMLAKEYGVKAETYNDIIKALML